ncbi:hypothetical protein NLX86_30010 [Streptomyces sp. A3M-1-3]|uniref:hypothetical protein n=1 Tax=Streptomyces sp. A3M-1-3 TaxID=2962044 RepID=UPI0020B6C22F|nr:hypothetical protein [Streptomyces sp. A3M-1-3]MCP3822174.1 hypothetical protein [Streptomyces sp. A3M-1-3]
MAAWTGETTLSTPLIVRPGERGGIAYTDELPTDRGENDALLHRGRSTVRHGKRGRPLFAVVHPNRQRRAMRKLLCHVCGESADRNELGVLWLLDNVPANCPQGWPQEEITAHPPLCLGCAAKAVEQCPELEKGFTAVRVRDPQPYGYRGQLYTRDLSRLRSPIPVVAKETENLAFDDPLLPWLLATQSTVCLVGCTTVDLVPGQRHD